MCIYEEKNTLCVSGTLCPCGYGFAQCEEQLLLFHCCSLDLASHEPEVQKWINFNLCLFLGERGAMCVCLILCTWWDLCSSSLSHCFTCYCSALCWLQQIPRGRTGEFIQESQEISVLLSIYIAFLWPMQLCELQSPDVAGRRCMWKRGWKLWNSSRQCKISQLWDLHRSALYLLGQSQPTLGQCWSVMWTGLVCALFNTDSGKMHFLWGLFCLRNQYNDFGVVSFRATPEALQKTREGKISAWCRTQLTVRLDGIMSCWIKKPLFRCLPWLYIPTSVMYAQVPYLHFILNNFYPLVIKVSGFLLHSSSCLSGLFLIWDIICNPKGLFAT